MTWEIVPDEELWEDGELDEEQVANKLYHRVTEVGDWVIVRRNRDITGLLLHDNTDMRTIAKKAWKEFLEREEGDKNV